MKTNPVLISFSIGLILITLISLFVLDEFVFQRDGIEISTDIDLTTYRISTAKSYEIYRQWTISENQRVFDWHLRSTKIIFWVSILVSIIGISFSFWQFSEASRDAQKAAESDEMEIKTQLISLAFKSRSIAASIMFISVAYLLIYVVLVYPIRHTPQSSMLESELLYSKGSLTEENSEKTSITAEEDQAKEVPQ